MTIDEFLASMDLHAEPPVPLPVELRALWWGRKGQWDRAHDLVNDLHSAMGSWIHAHLHRIEGDLGNAAHWYSRARKPIVSHGDGIHEEWLHLVRENLSV